eukprot:790286-Prorocentrum_minimum.AAC.1
MKSSTQYLNHPWSKNLSGINLVHSSRSCFALRAATCGSRVKGGGRGGRVRGQSGRTREARGGVR